jgi:ferredoxin
MAQITLWPAGESFETEEGTKLMTALKEEGHFIKSSCGGSASCADCIVVIKNGEENLSEPEFAEKKLLGNVFHITRERLSCQTVVNGDVTVDITAHNISKEQRRDTEMSNKKHTDNVRIRKKDDVDKIIEERREKSKEKYKEKKEKKQKEGGLRRPKPFKTDE